VVVVVLLVAAEVRLTGVVVFFFLSTVLSVVVVVVFCFLETLSPFVLVEVVCVRDLVLVLVVSVWAEAIPNANSVPNVKKALFMILIL